MTLSNEWARRHLGLHLERVVVLVQRHMRAYATRLVDGREHYTDRAVGRGELRVLLGQRADSDTAEPSWVDHIGVPEAPDLVDQMVALEHRIAAIEAQARTNGAKLPLVALREGFGLSPMAFDLFFATAAPRLALELSRLYPVAWADFAVKQAPCWFLCELVALAHGETPATLLAHVEADAPLVRWRLLMVQPSAAWSAETPLVHTILEVPERILSLVRGVMPDAGLAHGMTLHGRHDAPRLDEVVVEEPHRQTVLEALLKPATLPVRLVLAGPSGVGRRALVRAVMADRAVLEVRLESVLAGRAESARPESLLVEVVREAQVQQALLVLDLDGTPPDVSWVELGKLLAHFAGPVVVLVSPGDARARWVRELVPGCRTVVLGVPGPAAQERLWRARLEGWLGVERAAEVAHEIALRQRLTPAEMDRAVQRVVEGAGHGRAVSAKLNAYELLREARRGSDHQLGALADVVTTSMTLADVVLPPEVESRVREVIAYARHSDTVHSTWGFSEKSPDGRGLGVLFSGPPGTGKTLLATVLAGELGRVLYRVDLSRIVDKYIGETEKNLGRVFDEADKAQAVLLFDEADSLFAKRTDVKSSNDRYANLEVNFLLQRLEAYQGVSILTTNLVTSLGFGSRSRCPTRLGARSCGVSSRRRERRWTKASIGTRWARTTSFRADTSRMPFCARRCSRPSPRRPSTRPC
jgi:hypothetical protein